MREIKAAQWFCYHQKMILLSRSHANVPFWPPSRTSTPPRSTVLSIWPDTSRNRRVRAATHVIMMMMMMMMMMSFFSSSRVAWPRLCVRDPIDAAASSLKKFFSGWNGNFETQPTHATMCERSDRRCSIVFKKIFFFRMKRKLGPGNSTNSTHKSHDLV